MKPELDFEKGLQLYVYVVLIPACVLGHRCRHKQHRIVLAFRVPYCCDSQLTRSDGFRP